jgi:uncharacterized membrane protein YqjE
MSEAPQAPAERESIRGLFTRLGDEFIALIRSELRLAGGEVRENLALAAGGFVAVAVGLMMVSVAMLCLLGAGVIFLAQYCGLLAAALIVAAIATILGGIAIFFGIRRLKATDLSPKRLAANLRRDVDTLKGD